LQGVTASADGRLGSGRDVRAIDAEAGPWHELPLSRLWDAPLDQQLDRIWSALDVPLTSRPAGSDLLFLRARVMGVQGSALVTELIGAAGQLACTPPSDHVELAYVDNLRLLGACPGLELMLVGRMRPGVARAVRLLAVGRLDSDASHGLVLPSDWLGHVNVGLDRLQRANLPGASARPVVLRRADEQTSTTDPLDIVRRRVLQVAAGGVATVGQSAWSGIETDERQLERAQLRTGAALLRALRAAARARVSAESAPDPLARAWTALREYERHASVHLERLRWRD
jgi:hypothetical protein